MLTTFLDDRELNIPLEDDRVNKILEEVRVASKQDWQIVKYRVWTKKRLFRKRAEIVYYGLYLYVGGIGPWQQINFYRSDTDTSINPCVSLDLIVAFLLGYLAGLHSNLQNSQIIT